MRIIHLADIHANRERFDYVYAALLQIYYQCRQSKIDAVLISGDFWDSTMTNTKASHFVSYVDIMKSIAMETEVYMIYGTPSHEPEGSLEIFSYVGCHVHESFNPCLLPCDDKEIIMIPEPRLSTFKNVTIEEKYAAIQESYVNIALPKNPNKKRIVMFHGEVAGMRFQNGVIIPSGKAAMPIEVLRSYEADYYALGHIHMPQELDGLNGGYCGSLVPINFGEVHIPCYWDVII